MIKKSKKIFIFSSIGIGCFLLGTTSILSSCSTTTSNITPPPGQTTPDEPLPPTVSPEKPTQPTPTPPKPDKPLESVINQNSLSIKGIKSKILPSMLLNEKKQNIDISKFEKNYNTAEITSEVFTLIELDDLNGIISFEMSYQITRNNNKKFTFKFKDLMKMSTSSNFGLSFLQDGNSFLNAYQYSKQLIDNKYNIESFLKFIKLLANENKNKFVISDNMVEIPIDYLKISSYSINNWSDSWFTSSSKLSLNYKLTNPQVKFFQKNSNENNIVEKTVNFPTNVGKEFTVNFYSAADYVVHNVATDDGFSEQKTSDYYWGDSKFDSSKQTNLKLSTNGWLKNYNESLEGNSAKYKVVLADGSDSVSVLTNKDLSVNVRVKVEDNSSNTVYSTISKKIIISNIKKIVDDPFCYDSTTIENKFSFNQKAEKLDNNLQILQSDKESIKSFISNKNGQIDITSLLKNTTKERLKSSISNGMEVSFNGQPLTKDNSTKAQYYSNDDIFVESIGYNQNNFQYFYNKDQDVFQVKIIPTVGLSTLYTSNNPITVNITKPNSSLSKWN